MILVRTSRNYEAFKMSRTKVTILTSSRFTHSKENLQPEYSSFFKNAGRFLKHFDRIMYEITVLTITNHLQYRQNKTEKFPELHILPKM